MVEPFAVRMPPADVSVTVGAVIARLEIDVSSAVVETASEIVNVPPICSARVAIVNICAVAPVLLNVRLKNSASPRLAPAKVIVPPTAESKVTVPVPASQTAASVEAFVHVPETVHNSEPKSMADNAEEILTAPVITTFPLVLVRSPPDIVRLPADVMANVLLANVPPETVSAFVTMTAEPSVTVPAEMVRSSKVLSVERSVTVAMASKVTIPVPWV
jgi:hypothetical protein